MVDVDWKKKIVVKILWLLYVNFFEDVYNGVFIKWK